MKRNAQHLRRVEEVFKLIVDLPWAEQAEVLQRACAGDEDLRAEVESLLAYDQPESAPLHATRMLQALAPEDEPDGNLNRRIGPFTLVRRLGSGGMGNVYLALQTEPVRRTVAIKLIRRGIDTEEVVRRFAREQQVLASLNHPNIAQLHSAGATDDGLPYFVMEYVDGTPVVEYCRRHELDLAQKLALFQQVCAAVHFAHQNTIIHRDLKPANILVTAAGVPKLLDFGIAKLTTQQSGLDSQNTGAEQRFLTLEYASPEQVRGEPVTTAIDVFALGVILYELLTGARPRHFAHLSRQEAERRLREEDEVIRPSEKAPARLRRQLQGDLDKIVLTALRQDPSLRYASVEQFSADVGRFLRHEPVLATTPGMLYRVGKFARRNRAAFAVMVTILLGAIGSGAGAVWAVRAMHAAQQAQAAAQDRAEHLRRAVAVREVTLAFQDYGADSISSMKRRLRDVPEDLRDWEWRHLQSLTDDSLATWQGHTGEVRAVTFSPDGLHAASGGTDRTVRIWKDGILLHLLRGHQAGVNSLSFSGDGGQLASGGSDGVVQLWEVATGRLIKTLRSNGGSVQSVRFNPTSAQIALASQDRRIVVLNADSGDVAHTLQDYEGSFDSLAYSPDGRLLAAGGLYHTLRIWDTAGGAQVKSISEAGPVRSLQFTSDNRHLAVGVHGAAIQLRDTLSWNVVRKISGPISSSLALSPDGKLAVFARERPLARVVNTGSLQSIAYRGHDQQPLVFAYHPLNEIFATGAADGLVKVWNGRPDEQETNIFSTGADGVAGLAVSPDSRLVVLAGQERKLLFWDLELRREIRTCPHAHAAGISDVAFSPDGLRLASCSEDGVLKIWNALTADPELEIRAHQGAVRCTQFTPDGKRVLSCGDDGLVRTWDAVTGAHLRSMEGRSGPVLTLAVSPDGDRIASGGQDAAVRLWNSADGACLRVLSGHSATVHGVAFSADGLQLASGCADGTLRIWDPATGDLTAMIRGHSGPVMSVMFSASGRRLVSSGADESIRLWDTESRHETASFRNRLQGVTRAIFTPDQVTLVTGTRNGRLGLHDTLTYAQRLQTKAKLFVWTKAAGVQVDACRQEATSWQEVAGHFAPLAPESSDDSEQVRRRARSMILAHATTLPALAGPWTLSFFHVEPSSDLAVLEAYWRAAAAAPAHAERAARFIDFNWDGREPVPGLGANYFGLVATASIELGAGRYRFTLLSDDSVRMYVDGDKVVDFWTPHEPRFCSEELDLAGGVHEFRVEYLQRRGFARLGVYSELLAPGSSPVP